MHVIRLLSEGIELMRSGVITLPRPEKELLITIRTEQYGSLERVLKLANALFFELERAEPRASCQNKWTDSESQNWFSDTYLRHWNQSRA
jgi:uncharacterized protein